MERLARSFHRRGLVWSALALALFPRVTGASKKAERRRRRKKRQKRKDHKNRSCAGGFRTLGDCLNAGRAHCINLPLSSIQEGGCLIYVDHCCLWAAPSRGYTKFCSEQWAWLSNYQVCHPFA